MISDRCDFEEFVAVANEWNYQDIITNADREATEAERRFYHSNVSENEKALCGHDYAECLKGFIAFMRYGIKPTRLDPKTLQHFARIREEAMQIKPPSHLQH
jgi:hypothetical protein